jgi:O-antigen ligase
VGAVALLPSNWSTMATRNRRVVAGFGLPEFLGAVVGFVIPFEDSLPTVAGLSVSWFVFAAIGGFLLVADFGGLERAILSRASFALLAFCAFAGVMEILDVHPDISEPLRVFQMAIGALLIGALCWRRRSTDALLGGFVAAAVTQSFMLIDAVYSSGLSLNASNFEDASNLRGALFADGLFITNVNNVATVTAVSSVICASVALRSRAGLGRRLLYLVVVITAFATLLTFSRGGVLVLVIGMVVVTVREAGSVRVTRAILMVGLGMALVVMLVPSAALARLTSNEGDYQDPRQQTFSALTAEISSYAISGIGYGNYYASWAGRHGLVQPVSGSPRGPHNGFLAVVAYWGLGAASLMMVVIFQTWRTFRRGVFRPVIREILFPLFFMVLVALAFSDQLHFKLWGIAIGLAISGVTGPRSLRRSSDNRHGSLKHAESAV